MISKMRENQESLFQSVQERLIYGDAYFKVLNYFNGDALDFTIENETKY